MENSKISWTDHTFNPWIGCTKVSPGCDRCYAERQMDHRWGKVKWGPGSPRQLTSDAYWKAPLRWDADAARSGVRARVFCASLADVFDGEVPPEWRDQLFRLIDATPHLDWLLLTKRPQLIRDQLRAIGRERVPAHVWLGTSVEDNARARRLQALLHQPAAVHWVSAEPLLGPVDWLPYLLPNPFGGVVDWIVFGGESTQGAEARPCHLSWVRDGIAQVRAANTQRRRWDQGHALGQCAVHVKQLGDNAVDFEDGPAGPGVVRLPLSAKGGEVDEWPEDLKIREFPGRPTRT